MFRWLKCRKDPWKSQAIDWLKNQLAMFITRYWRVDQSRESNSASIEPAPPHYWIDWPGFSVVVWYTPPPEQHEQVLDGSSVEDHDRRWQFSADPKSTLQGEKASNIAGQQSKLTLCSSRKSLLKPAEWAWALSCWKKWISRGTSRKGITSASWISATFHCAFKLQSMMTRVEHKWNKIPPLTIMDASPHQSPPQTHGSSNHLPHLLHTLALILAV